MSSHSDHPTSDHPTSDCPALTALGWDREVAQALAEAVPPVGHGSGLLPGRVVRVERGACVVALDDGDHSARTPVVPAVGDWVGVRRRGTDLSVETIARRRSQLARRDPEGLTQVLATNLDVVLITAPADRLSAARVERETAAAWDSGAQPLVLVTKVDLAPDGLVDDLRARLIGVDVVETSALTGEGTENVAAALRPCRTAVLLGPSGAGKSTLANALLRREQPGAERPGTEQPATEWLATSDVRAGDRRGRHTTTSRHLLVLPGGGVLIDTPGLRSLSLAGGDGLARTFADIEALAHGCRFADCRHEQEPGCAVVAAADAGDLDVRRVSNYHKLQRELDFETRRDDPVARGEIRRKHKIQSKMIKRFNQDRGQRR